MKEVHIIGRGIGWEEGPTEGETWGVNDVIYWRDVKLLFNMHDMRKHFGNTYVQTAINKINRLKIPLMSVMCYPEIPTSMRFPIEEISKAFGTDYFTNGIDYEIAYAIYLGFEKIHLYGINMVQSSEYAYEKPGLEYWSGFARGRGVEVKFYGEHITLMRTWDGKLYGYENRWQREVQELRERLIELEKKKELTVQNCYLYEKFVLEKAPKTRDAVIVERIKKELKMGVHK